MKSLLLLLLPLAAFAAPFDNATLYNDGDIASTPQSTPAVLTGGTYNPDAWWKMALSRNNTNIIPNTSTLFPQATSDPDVFLPSATITNDCMIDTNVIAGIVWSGTANWCPAVAINNTGILIITGSSGTATISPSGDVTLSKGADPKELLQRAASAFRQTAISEDQSFRNYITLQQNFDAYRELTAEKDALLQEQMAEMHDLLLSYERAFTPPKK